MLDSLLDSLHASLGSPWFLLAMAAMAALDGFLPLVPAETMLLTAGALTARADPRLAATVTAAAIGAFLGDHLLFVVVRKLRHGLAQNGRGWSRRAQSRLVRGRLVRGRLAQQASSRVAAWTQTMLQRRGRTMLVTARFVPGCRTAAIVSAAVANYPMRKFTQATAIAAPVWASYNALAGIVGGVTFSDNPILGVAMGIGIATTLAASAELLRRRLTPTAQDGAHGGCSPRGMNEVSETDTAVSSKPAQSS